MLKATATRAALLNFMMLNLIRYTLENGMYDLNVCDLVDRGSDVGA